MRLFLIGLPAFVCSLGCGSTTTASEATTPVIVPCEQPDQARLGNVCESLAGSRWLVSADLASGASEFEIELLGSGQVRSNESRPDGLVQDEWFIESNALRIFLSQRFVEYRGLVTNGTLISGTAQNISGETWTFRARRQASSGSCPEDEVERDGVCYSMVGLMFERADHTVIRFLDGGRLETVGASAVGTWSLQGGALTLNQGSTQIQPPFSQFSLNGVAHTRVARLPSRM